MRPALLGWARGLRRLLCQHRHLQRVTLEGVRYFRCACGYQVEQIHRAHPVYVPLAHEQLRARAIGPRPASDRPAGRTGGGDRP